MSSTTVSTQIYTKLLEGESPTELRKAFGSGSAMTKAMQQYVNQVTPRVEALQRQRTQLRKALDTMETDLQQDQRQLRTSQQAIQVADAALAKQREQQRQLNTTIETQQTQLKQTREEAARITRQLHELHDRGITSKLIARIHRMEVKADSDLLTSVQTAHDVHQTQQRLEALQTEEAHQTRKLHDLTSQLKIAQRTLRETENQRDEVERSITTLHTSIDVLRSFFKEGYSPQDLTSLRNGLTFLQLPKDPQRSITRLVMAIQEASTLTDLNKEIQLREATLATLQSNLMKVQGELDAYHDHVVARLAATHAEHQKQFDALLESVNERATTTTQTITQHIDEVAESIRRVRDRAAATGDAIRRLEALGPLLVFLDKGTGTPGTLLPYVLQFLKQFTTWLNNQPPPYYYNIKLQVENVIHVITTTLEREGWRS